MKPKPIETDDDSDSDEEAPEILDAEDDTAEIIGSKDQEIAKDTVNVDDDDVDGEIDDDSEFTPVINSITNNLTSRKIIIDPDNRHTSNRLSLFEMAEIISIRAKQIAENMPCMVDTSGLDTPDDMAKRELMMRKCILSIERVVKIGVDKTGTEVKWVEHWNPNEMEFSRQWDI